MLFNEFGSKENPTLLLMHGMMQDWHSMYKYLHPLEEHYHLIFIAMDGFYDGSEDFTTFADQCRQIEEYVNENCGGELFAVYGASQGGLMAVELLTRNRIKVRKTIMDGCYVAHQGWLAGWGTYKIFRYIQKNNGRIPGLMNITFSLTGMKKEDMQAEMDALYLKASEVSMKRNFIQNYTYRTRPEIAQSETMVYLWCGSKEPYALKSHRILKRYLRHYEEEIFEGYGHGEFLMKHIEENCEKIRQTLGRE